MQMNMIFLAILLLSLLPPQLAEPLQS